MAEENRKLFPFLNEVRSSIRAELERRRDALTEIVTPFARFTSMKEKTVENVGVLYKYFHMGLQGAGNIRNDELTNVFDLSYGAKDVVGYAYDDLGNRIPISLEEEGLQDVSDGTHPIPGITSIFVEHKGANSPVYFEVRWVCYNISQLDYLRQHFMVAGSYVAIEYGQYYAGLDGNESSDLNNSIAESQYNWVEKHHTQLALDYLQGRANIVQNYAANCGGNYDIWVGQIIDYEITMREDGSYDCLTRAYSIGECLFSIGNYSPLYSFKDSSAEEGEEEILSYSQIVHEYFKPFGGLEVIVRALAIEQEKEQNLLVVNTTSADFQKTLMTEENEKELYSIEEIRNEINKINRYEKELKKRKLQEQLLYFGDAQWFVRFQTFIDTIIPDLLRWINAANISQVHLDAFKSINRPTYAEQTQKQYVFDQREITQDTRAWRAQQQERMREAMRPTGFDLATPESLESSLDEVRAIANEDPQISDSSQPSRAGLGYEIGPTDVVGNNPYLVSTDPTVLIIKFNTVEVYPDENDNFHGRGLVVELSENERSGKDEFEEDEEVQLSIIKADTLDISCKIDNSEDFGSGITSNEEFFDPAEEQLAIAESPVAYWSEGVWLNVNAIQEAFLSSETLHQGFTNLLRRINAATGNYWKLELVYDEELNQYNIVDMGLSTLESKKDIQAKAYQFNYKTKGEVLNLTFNAKMSNEMKAAMMLTAEGSDMPAYGTSLYGMILNKRPFTDLFGKTMSTINVPNRVNRREAALLEKLTDASENEGSSSDKESASTEKVALTDIGESVGQAYRERFFEKFNNAIRKYIGVPGYMIPAMGQAGANQLRETGVAHNSYLAPVPTEVELNLTIRGIAGLAFHDVFTVDKLPSIYLDYGVFLINRLSHEISDQGWLTHIGGLYYFMWPKKEDLPTLSISAKDSKSSGDEYYISTSPVW